MCREIAMFKKCFDRFKSKSKNSLRTIDKNTMLKIIRNLKNKCLNISKEKRDLEISQIFRTNLRTV